VLKKLAKQLERMHAEQRYQGKVLERIDAHLAELLEKQL
jgi:hypothetical protein